MSGAKTVGIVDCASLTRIDWRNLGGIPPLRFTPKIITQLIQTCHNRGGTKKQ